MRAWEFWKDRFHINVRAMQTGNYELGNTVWIRNLSGKPVIVEYWEAFPDRRRHPGCRCPGVTALSQHLAAGPFSARP